MKESAKTATGRSFQFEMGSRPRPGQGLVIGPDYVEGCYYCRVLVRVFGGLGASPFEKAQMLKAIDWFQIQPHNWLCFRCKDLPEARQAAPRRNNNRAPLAQGFGIVDQQGNFVGFAQPGGGQPFPQAAPAPEQMQAPVAPQQLQPQQPQQPMPTQQPPQQFAPPPQQLPQQPPQPPPPQNGHAQPPQPPVAYPHAVPQAPQVAAPQQQQQYAPPLPQAQAVPAQQQPYAFQHRDYSSLGRRARKDWRMHSGSPASLPPERQPAQYVDVHARQAGDPEPDFNRARAVAEGDPNAPQPALGGAPTATLTTGSSPDPSQQQPQS